MAAGAKSFAVFLQVLRLIFGQAKYLLYPIVTEHST